MTKKQLRISFGMIVLNGAPFITYNLRALYPFAHEIFVVEGAVPAAANLATENGRSRDNTLSLLKQFKEKEDPENKLQIITRDGFWTEKDEQSRAYAAQATGDFLWQVDVDEFYQPNDIRAIIDMLAQDRGITAVFFQQRSFWGGFDYISDGWYLRQPQGEGPGMVPRIFKWGDGYQYASHRPVTVLDDQGQNVKTLRPVNGRTLAAKGIFMYHYSLVFPRQVREKSAYYGAADWARRYQAQQWAEEVYLGLKRPYRVHNVYSYPSWLENFRGEHPPQIQALRQDIEMGAILEPLRPIQDIDQLLQKRGYKIGRWLLKLLSPIAILLIVWRRRLLRRR